MPEPNSPSSSPKQTDTLVTLKSIVLFTVLTILNVFVFVFMVWENQMDLIGKNAELESKDKGIILKMKVEEIVTGHSMGGVLPHFRVAKNQALVFDDHHIQASVTDTLTKGDPVVMDYEMTGWYRVLFGRDQTGWMLATDLIKRTPPWQRGLLDAEDISMVLQVLEAEGVREYAVFTEGGAILADSKGREGQQATEKEKRLIKQAVFKNSFENLAFYHDVNIDAKQVDLYIPIYYTMNQLVVLKPTIPMQYVNREIRNLYRLCLIAGMMVLIVHTLFVLINQRIVILPMVRERTQILRTKNEQIQAAKNQLQGAYDQLNQAHSLIQSELDIAREIQLTIIPAEVPKVPGYRFYTKYIPAEKVGGDFYDFYRIDDEHLGIVIADASGHGIPAAFVVSMAKMSFTAHAKHERSTATIMDRVNRELENAITTSHYLTAVCVVLHIPTGKITYTRASHPAPVHYRKQNGALHHLDTQGLFVGMMEDGGYGEGESVLEPGDRLILFTDGVNEAVDADQNQYGKKSVDRVVQGSANCKAEQLAQVILDDVRKFTKGFPFQDDVTLVVLERDVL